MRQLLTIVIGIAMSWSASASINEGIAAYNSGNYAVAFKEFNAAAKDGNAVGKHLLASLYYQGHGVERNLEKAVSLFKEAAEANYPPSLANLALMYSIGDGVPKDLKNCCSVWPPSRRDRRSAVTVQPCTGLSQGYRRTPRLREGGLLVSEGGGSRVAASTERVRPPVCTRPRCAT
jgi:tetratricopeptide (TPR) repeat protein